MVEFLCMVVIVIFCFLAVKLSILLEEQGTTLIHINNEPNEDPSRSELDLLWERLERNKENKC